VPTRMLNGGMSLSAIFKAGQLRPQARLRNEHDAGCRVGSVMRGGTWHVGGVRQAERRESLCTTGAGRSRKGRGR
jgi:hypothetical protein